MTVSTRANPFPMRKVVEALKQAALKAEALRGVRAEGNALAARRRLHRCMDTLAAAWSPWSAGGAISEECEPPGWEISSHKDQLMRQVKFDYKATFDNWIESLGSFLALLTSLSGQTRT